MPRRLLERCRPDSIREFRAAARQRFDDGLSLAAAGRRTGAIYLFGYTAEMILKAAYFSLSGLTETDTITWNVHRANASNSTPIVAGSLLRTSEQPYDSPDFRPPARRKAWLL